jgi:hypothetical protein
MTAMVLATRRIMMEMLGFILAVKAGEIFHSSPTKGLRTFFTLGGIVNRP